MRRKFYIEFDDDVLDEAEVKDCLKADTSAIMEPFNVPVHEEVHVVPSIEDPCTAHVHLRKPFTSVSLKLLKVVVNAVFRKTK